MFPVTSQIDDVLPFVSVLRGALSFKKYPAVLCLSLTELREYTLYYFFMFNFCFNFHLGHNCLSLFVFFFFFFLPFHFLLCRLLPIHNKELNHWKSQDRAKLPE